MAPAPPAVVPLQPIERTAEFLEAVLDNLPLMVFVKDADDLRYVRLNVAGERLTGLDRQGILGKTDPEIFPPDIAAFFQDKDRRTLAAGQVVDIPEEQVQTPHGRRWLHTLKVPIPDADGAPRYLLGISLDITEPRGAAEAIRRAAEATEVSNRELESFAYSVSHDLRAPLRAIDGFSQALLEDEADALSARGKDYLARVRNAAGRMTALIDHLLELSRVGRAALAPVTVDLATVVAEIEAELRAGAPTRTVTVAITGDLTVVGDPVLLAVVMRNLLGNAWKYTSRRAHAHIAVDGRQTDDAVEITIRDDGAGFDPAYAGKLFAPFQRLHTTSEFPGDGVGLATVRRIVHRHGGRVEATGALDAGATITVRLPRDGAGGP